MNLRSVKDLYLVKQVISKCPDVDKKSLMEVLNGVLLREGGSKAVLYPYNDLRETILELFGQCMSPKDIAIKVGLGEYGEETVICVVEDPTNYEEEEECSDAKTVKHGSQEKK